ncbi:MAG: hypothetical protein M1438_17340 [Deltaproteobacteria bacterium]|nr:hypothetical protein [Deltaproteobacteria bacterium]
MFDGLNYITLYWLSGFAEAKYEIWDSKKISIERSEDCLSFSVYLSWPQDVADEARITIRRTEAGLVFATDWFPDEEFDLKPYESQEGGGIILMSKFLRETFFIHLREQYE